MEKHPKSHDALSDETRPKVSMPFDKTNFIMMACCMALIIIGFLLMSGGGSATDTEFNPEIFSTRRIVVGPLLTFLGFLLMAFAIIWSPRKKKSNHTTKNSNNDGMA